MVRDRDARVRTAALFALQGKEHPCIAEALLHALKDEDVGVRKSAVQTIRKSNYVGLIVRLLLESSEDLRPMVPEILMLLLKEKALSSTWKGIIQLLKKIRDPRIIQFFLEALVSPDSRPQPDLLNDPRYLIEALNDLNPNWRQSPEAKAAVPELLKVLRPRATPSPVREAAAWVLVKIRDERVMEWMASWVENAYRLPQIELIDQILDGLCNAEDRRAIHPLISILEMGNSNEHEQIIRAIGSLVNRFARDLREDELKEIAAVKDGSSTKPRYRTEYMDMDMLSPMEIEVPDGTYVQRIDASRIRETAKLELNRRSSRA